MNNPGSQNPSNTGKISTVGEKTMNKGPCQMTGGRMNDQPRRLIQDDKGGIFMDEGKLYSFRPQMVRPGRRNRDGYSVRGLEPVTWLGLPIVNQDGSIPDEVLNP